MVKQYLLTAIKSAVLAGNEILKIYDSEDFDVSIKKDNSPLTKADQASDHIIKTLLKKTFPLIPILSEESKEIPFETRKEWKTFWLVDPMDGTKEFICRNGEFTVNIALIHIDKPVLGVITVPARDLLYFAGKDLGAYKMEGITNQYDLNSKNIEKIIKNAKKLPLKLNKNSLKVVASRSHMNNETKKYIQNLEKDHQSVEIVSAGSSLKLCMVAEGAANIYPRLGPTMEWDTAAGQAIVESAGGAVLQYIDNTPLRYNKEDLLNPFFIVKGSLNL